MKTEGQSKLEGQAVYDEIGRSYDQTRTADPEIVATISKLLERKVNGRYLDIGCGSGNYTVALAKSGYSMTGMDVSEKMLRKARKKTDDIDWVHGDARNLNFDDSQFDGAICILATHHIQQLDKAFGEAHRVLKPGSNFIIFTETPEQMHGSWLNHYFPKMMDDSGKVLTTENKLMTLLTKTGFGEISTEKFFVTNDLKDLFLNAGKYRPEIYLDPAVRAGISSFAKLSNEEEVNNGLSALKEDIESGAVQDLIEIYENQKGDYLFMVATK